MGTHQHTQSGSPRRIPLVHTYRMVAALLRLVLTSVLAHSVLSAPMTPSDPSCDCSCCHRSHNVDTRHCCGGVESCDTVCPLNTLVKLFKIGFPMANSCGQEQVVKSLLNPHYVGPLLGGFKEGQCADVGYTVFVGNVTKTMKPFP